MADREGIEDFVLRLPAPLRDRAEEMAASESVSLNLFVLMAVAEKLQRMQLQHCLDLKEEHKVRSEPSSSALTLIH